MNFISFVQQICGDEVPKFLIFDVSTAPPLLFYSYIPILILSLAISFFILIRDKKTLQSRLLFVFTLFFALWIINILVQWVASYHTVLMFAWQLTATLEVAMFVFAGYFAYAFLFKRNINSQGRFVLALIITIVAVLMPSQFNIATYDVLNCEGVVGTLWSIIYIFEPLVIVFIGYLGFIKYRQVEGNNDRIQVLFFTLGICLFLTIFFISNFDGELTRIYEFNLWGPLGMVIFLGFLAYIIVKFNTFNTKLFSSQVLVIALVSLIFSLFFIKNSQSLFIILSISLIMVIIFGSLLTRSVKREILQRQKIEVLAGDLGRANTRLMDLDKQKSEFVSFATHQLRAPLTAMKGYASLILEGELGSVTTETKQAIGRIYDSSNTLTSIVDDYLNISRIELGMMKYSFGMIDLRDLIEHVVGELKPNIEKKGIKFTFAKDSGVRFMVHADRAKLKQVIANLIDNSIKYTPSGSVIVSLVKNLDTRKILFSIKDTGVGISREVMPKLFTKFVRAENANKQNIYGTGLGLYVASEIVKAHKGRLWAESEGDGKGSTFLLELDMEV